MSGRRVILRTCHECGQTFTRTHFRDLIKGLGEDGPSEHQQCSACYLHPSEDWRLHVEAEPDLFSFAGVTA